jgi:hypothetical protein
MNLIDAMKKARDFIVFTLKADAGSLAPMGADKEGSTWKITYQFVRFDVWQEATIDIDDWGDVISFQVEDIGEVEEEAEEAEEDE